jgi:phenylalanyl-tRNA synthetase beta chain
MDKEMNPQQILTEHPKGKDYSWIFEGVTEYPIVLDSKGVVSFPPIINAERTRVTESTKNLFIDVTGSSERAVRDTLHVLLTAFHDRGAKIENVRLKFVDGQRDSAVFERTEKMDMEFMNKTLGLRLKPPETVQLLSRMGHIAKEGEKTIEIEVPPYRADIMHQVDFVEDVAIAYGYGKFKPVLPKLITIGKESESAVLDEDIRMAMVGMGFNEVMTWTLTNEEKNSASEIMEEAVEIKNPRTRDFTLFRTSLLPSLLSTLADNKTKSMPQRIFEIGRVSDAKGKCRTVLGAAITGPRATFSDVKGVLDVIAEMLKMKAEQEDKPFCIPGRCVSVRDRKETGGWCGEISPKVLQNFRLEMPVAAFEVAL